MKFLFLVFLLGTNVCEFNANAQPFRIKEVQGSCVKGMVSNKSNRLYAFAQDRSILVSLDSGASWQTNAWQPHLPSYQDYQTKVEYAQTPTVLAASSAIVYCGITMAGTDYTGLPQGGGIQNSTMGKQDNSNSAGSVTALYAEDSLIISATQWHLPSLWIYQPSKGETRSPLLTTPSHFARVGSVLLGTNGDQIMMSRDTLKSASYVVLPDMAWGYDIAASTDGVFVVAAKKSGQGDCLLYYSTDTAKTWQGYEQPFTHIESIAFVGTTLMLNTQKPCLTDVEPSVAMPVTQPSVVPNPATEFVELRYAASSLLPIRIQVYTMKGECKPTTVHSRGADSWTIDIHDWEQGVYTVVLWEGNTYKSLRCMVLH